jgi:signal peptidase I
MFRFINRQQYAVEYQIDGKTVSEPQTLWFGPDDDLKIRQMGFDEGRVFKKGEALLKIKEIAGDHLFVDRLTYNFRQPKRGEIIVFKTAGIEAMPRQDQFYIKRLVGMPNEKMTIGNDHHVRINGEKLTAATPHFEFVYSFGPIHKENHYFGHVNQETSEKLGRFVPAPYFQNEKSLPFTVGPKHYTVFGDNTLNSFDSRAWGDFPQKNVIGKSFFVYWPISNHGKSRFGWGHR